MAIHERKELGGGLSPPKRHELEAACIVCVETEGDRCEEECSCEGCVSIGSSEFHAQDRPSTTSLERESLCVCVCVCGKEKDRPSTTSLERESLCVCVREKERERDSEFVCVCAYVSV